MSNDRFTEVTTTSWLGRIGQSIKGIFFGLLLVAGAGILIFWNEGRAVKRAKTLAEGTKAVVTVSAERVDPANEGKLVHLIAKAATTETLADAEFGVSAPALKLRRTAEMYQWKEDEKKETKKNVGGSSTTTTTYSYHRIWSTDLIDSSRFKHPEGHANPHNMLYTSRSIVAQIITAGAFTLSKSLVSRIDNFTDRPFSTLEELPQAMRSKCKLVNGNLYFSAEPASPQVGDLRVSFQVANPTMVSLVARQLGNSFEPYISKVGGELELLEVGEFSSGELFRQARQMNLILTWVLRAVGLLVMWFGFALVLKPLSVVADFLPFVGNIVAFGTGLIAFMVAAVLSVGTVAFAWVYYRPVLSVVLVGGVLAVVFGVIRLKKRRIPG